MRREGPPNPEEKDLEKWLNEVAAEIENPDLWAEHIFCARDSGQETPSVVNLMQAVGDDRLFSELSEQEQLALIGRLGKSEPVQSKKAVMIVQENDIIFQIQEETSSQ